jgi:hypothetical protein
MTPSSIQLKGKWACQKHQGKHGQNGYCYVSSTGEHLGPVARLYEVMGAIKGRVWKFRVFCKEWSARLEEKKCIN